MFRLPELKPSKSRLPRLLLFLLVLVTAFRAVGAEETGDRGRLFAPFKPEKRAEMVLSDPDRVRLSHEKGPLNFRHRVSFLPAEDPVEIQAPLLTHGANDTSYFVNVTGRVRLKKGGMVELAILHEGKKILARVFQREGMTPFAYPICLWGGEAYRIRLSARSDTEILVEDLFLEYPAPAPPERPGLLNYYKRQSLPLDVMNRNTHRALEALNRDLTKGSGILYRGLLTLIAILVTGWLSKRLFKASKRSGKSLKVIKRLKLGSFASLATCGLFLLAILLEFLFRLWISCSTGEAVFLTYPLGFNLEDIHHIYYERDNPFRFDTVQGDTKVAHLSSGKEISYHGTYYYDARINVGGYRGELKPLPNENHTVLCIGGSSTYGMNNDGETYPDYLQAALDRVGEGGFTVFNLGIQGLEASRFQGRVKHLLNIRPDYIVIYAGFNDMCVSEFEIYAVEQSIARGRLLYGPAHYSLLCRNLLAAMLERSEERMAPRLQEFNREVSLDLNVLLARAESYAGEIDQVLRYAHAIGSKVLYINEFTSIGEGTSLETFQEFTRGTKGRKVLEKTLLSQSEKALLSLTLLQLRIRKLVEDNGYTHVFCLEPRCFESLNPGEILVDWVHLNARGNRLLGEFMGEKLLDVEKRKRSLEEKARNLTGRNLLEDGEWSFNPPVRIQAEGDGHLVTCPRARFVLSRAIPDPSSLSGCEALYVRITIEANHPLVHLSARLLGPKLSIPLNAGGLFLPKGENTFTWVGELNGVKVQGPLRVELTFAGSNKDTEIRIQKFEAFK